MPLPSEMDVAHYAELRANVERFMQDAGKDAAPGRLLDIAPQDHAGARPFFPDSVEIVTFDIEAESGADVIGDITMRNDTLADESFDYIVCTEVLEHVLQPFAAVAEMRRLLRPGGTVFVTTPYNFRIHGPLPDCWRFTEHGLRALFAGWQNVTVEGLETPDRPLMPIHYTLTAQR